MSSLPISEHTDDPLHIMYIVFRFLFCTHLVPWQLNMLANLHLPINSSFLHKVSYLQDGHLQQSNLSAWLLFSFIFQYNGCVDEMQAEVLNSSKYQPTWACENRTRTGSPSNEYKPKKKREEVKVYRLNSIFPVSSQWIGHFMHQIHAVHCWGIVLTRSDYGLSKHKKTSITET